MNCKICDKIFSGIDNYKQHEVSEKHKKKVMLYLQNNGTPSDIFSVSSQATCDPLSQNNNTFPCVMCSKNFYSLSDFMQHSISKEHANMVLNKNSEISRAESQMEVCSSSTDELSMSKSGMDCLYSIDQLKKDSALLNQSRSANPYYTRCEPCDKCFSGPESYHQHIVSSKHIKKCSSLPLNALQKEEPKIIANNIASDVCDKGFNNFSNTQQSEGNINPMKPMLAESSPVKENFNNNPSFALNNLICEICDMTFTGPIPHNMHMQSMSHKKGIERKQLLNQIFGGKENIQTGVAVCSTPKPSGTSISSPWYCETCNKICSGPEPYRAHMVSDKHRKTVARTGAECKKSEIRNIMSKPPGEVDIFSSQKSGEANFSMMEDNNAGYVSAMPEKEVNDSFMREPSTLSVDLAQLNNMTFFKVGEEIDFDKNEKCDINILEIDCMMDDDDNEETTYDDMPSP